MLRVCCPGKRLRRSLHYDPVGDAVGIRVGAPVCGMPRGPEGSCRTASTINMTVSALTTMMWNGKAGMCRISLAVI